MSNNIKHLGVFVITCHNMLKTGNLSNISFHAKIMEALCQLNNRKDFSLTAAQDGIGEMSIINWKGLSAKKQQGELKNGSKLRGLHLREVFGDFTYKQ